jgi:2-isopropylmalate synthase
LLATKSGQQSGQRTKIPHDLARLKLRAYNKLTALYKGRKRDKTMFDHTKYRPFAAINKPDRKWPANTITKAPIWCSVDLRDGNQALIEPMNVSQKLLMWDLLIRMGFKNIEVGFPSASQTDFDFVRTLIDEKKIPDDVTIQVLVQARDQLIKRTFESLKGAKQAIVHVYNSTSPVQRKKVFNLDKQGIIDIAKHGASKVMSCAQQQPETHWTFQYSPESFSSTEVDFAVEVCNAVVDVWQPTAANKCIINLPATVECAGPNIFADQVELFCETINNRNSIIISIHTHNDRGCAVAAAEMAILAGADRIEGTLMGNGERTGNMDIITMGMNLYSQGIDPQLDLSDAYEITKTVEECTNIPTHARHPWMGDLVYTAFSGSHQDAIKKCLSLQSKGEVWDVAYLPIDPNDIGKDYQSVIRVNSQSGKGGVAYMLEANHGIQLPRWMQIEVSQAVQKYTEENQCEVNSDTIWEIYRQTFNIQDRTLILDGYEISNHNEQQTIKAEVTKNGRSIIIKGEGQGALEAFCNGLSQHFAIDIDIKQYEQTSIGEHNNAKALAMISMTVNGKKFVCSTDSDDTLKASFNTLLVGVEMHFDNDDAVA